MKHGILVALATTLVANTASAQVAMRPRPTIGQPPAATQTVPAIIRPGGLGNRASRLEPTSYLGQSEFNTLIGHVGTPNDFAVPAFSTSFKITPLAPSVASKGTLLTRDGLNEPDYNSEIVGGGAVINFISRASAMTFNAVSFDSIGPGGAEITISALRGEVYAVDCLASVNGDPNAKIYYRTSNPSGNGAMIAEQSVNLKGHHFVTLVKRSNQNGDIKIIVRPEAYLLPAVGSGGLFGSGPSMDPLAGLNSMLERNRRAALTPEQRAAEDAAKAAAAPPPPPVPRYEMKLWGCQVSSAN